MAYDINESIRCNVEFKNRSGAFVDPTTITFKIKSPTGTITTYTYITDEELVKESTGRYYIIVEPDESGTWHYRFSGTGTIKAAGESRFTVKPTQF